MRQLFINVSQLQIHHPLIIVGWPLTILTMATILSFASRGRWRHAVSWSQYAAVLLLQPGGPAVGCGHLVAYRYSTCQEWAVGGFHFLWPSNTLYTQSSYYSDIQEIPWVCSPARQNVPWTSSCTGNIQTGSQLAFCTPFHYSFGVRFPLRCLCFTEFIPLLIFWNNSYYIFLCLNYFMVSVSWLNLNWKAKEFEQTKFLANWLVYLWLEKNSVSGKYTFFK